MTSNAGARFSGRVVRPSGRLFRTLPAAMAVLAVALSLGGCGKEAGAPPAGAAAAPPPIAVTVVEVAPQRVPIVFDAVGQTEGAKQVEVRARVSGILQKQLYKEGDAVAPARRCSRSTARRSRSRWHRRGRRLEQDKARTEQTQREEARLKPLAAGSRHQPQGIRRRALGGAARGGGAAAERRESARGRAQPFLHAGRRAGGGRDRPRGAFGRHADHHRLGRQPAHHHQPGQSDLGALQPRPVRSREDSGGPAGRQRCGRRAAHSARRHPLSRQGPAQFHGHRVRHQARHAAAARGVRQREASSFCPGSSCASRSRPARATTCSSCRNRR